MHVDLIFCDFVLLGSIPMVVGLSQLETKLNAIIYGGLVFHNWRQSLMP